MQAEHRRDPAARPSNGHYRYRGSQGRGAVGQGIPRPPSAPDQGTRKAWSKRRRVVRRPRPRPFHLAGAAGDSTGAARSVRALCEAPARARRLPYAVQRRKKADESETTPHLEIRGECASETPAEIKTPSPREAELAARAAELENVLAAPSATRPMGGATSPPVPLRRYWLTNWGRTHADCAVQQFVTPPVDSALPTLRNKGRPIRFKEELSTGSHPL
jgi:hypothetical protein